MVGDQVSSQDHVSQDDGTIEVRLRELDQLFNTMDPAPFHEKELDRDPEEFILSAAKESPVDVPLALLVQVGQPKERPNAVQAIRDAVRANFARRAQASGRGLRELFRRGRISLAIGLPCLAASLSPIG
jgi:hypothetical protein